MTDQQKLYRVFRLLQLLSQRPYRNVPHLASVLETSRETVYKYIRLLESVGYQIDKDEHNRPETTADSLAKLKPAFRKEGTITAGRTSAARPHSAQTQPAVYPSSAGAKPG